MQKPQGNRRKGKENPGIKRVVFDVHPRNRHQGRYDFAVLTAACPELAPLVIQNPNGEPTIDFSNPVAVKWLNRALLMTQYGITYWDIPPGYLCPPIPGRADYLHYVADLLASENQGIVPTGTSVRVLDVGVGANAIYPILGNKEYGWRFVGTDIDKTALKNAKFILEANPGLDKAVDLRQQKHADHIFQGVIRAGDRFDVTICNPPFHASIEDATAGTQRKWSNLGKPQKGKAETPVLNFGGQGAELWCPGGEVAFLQKMAKESVHFATHCRWFTSLLSRSENLPAVEYALQQAGAAEIRVIDMAQGQKRSRIVAWRFEVVFED
ncbi:23S rRNA (adenine(1618)-N(6))-methyltransferase RlmF [Leeia oryzae]|uniref:23S rRNA (adenine(1618)-N(6))-methyltransferase RlmF n=1 Tax=Leeia oryzae TaxID=356662 RepID=UPI000366A374|nr:23S rRNA (adenine(1618)-N(6))-methyltransferase RlmF [Leeia oryzae]